MKDRRLPIGGVHDALDDARDAGSSDDLSVKVVRILVSVYLFPLVLLSVATVKLVTVAWAGILGVERTMRWLCGIREADTRVGEKPAHDVLAAALSPPPREVVRDRHTRRRGSTRQSA
jgi:hypothetical protein